MTRRRFLTRMAGTAAATAVGRAAARDPAGLSGRRPNVVLILTDDQGPGDMAWAGHPHLKTPHLDALRAQSLWFSAFQVSPTCAPTRCALLTGRHEFFSGVTHTIFERERMSLNARTLPQALKSAGYATGIFGKWHLGDEDAYQPGQRGFDEVYIHGGGGIGQTYPGSCGDVPNNQYANPVLRHNGRFVRTKGFCTDLFFDEALRWIDTRRASGAPFFCCLTPNAPHSPYHAPDAWKKRYVAAGLDDAAAGFCGMVENLDANVGKLLAALDAWDLSRDTLVLFLGDNGSCHSRLFDAGLRGAKGSPHEGGTRVGLLARWPGTVAGGTACDALTAHVDLYPTLCALAGVVPPAGQPLDGRSLVPLLHAPDAAWPDRMLFTHVGRWAPGSDPDAAQHKTCAVRTARYRFVNHTELYDMAADRKQTRNIAAEHPDEVARLRAAYDDWWASVRPHLENEAPHDVPLQNPYKTAYWQQFGF